MDLFKEFWAFLKIRKKFWLAPILLFVLVMTFLALAGSVVGALSPLIYAF